MRGIILFLLVLLTACSEQFTQLPDSRPIESVIKTAIPLARAASMNAIAITGTQIANTSATSCNAYPCSTDATVQIKDGLFPLHSDNIGHIYFASRWTSANQGIALAVFVDRSAGNGLLPISKVSAFPFTRTNNGIDIVYTQLHLNIDLDINGMSDQEVQDELNGLNQPNPNDPEIAMGMGAWLVQVDFQGTPTDFTDDTYSITGGGQEFSIGGGNAQVIQLALVGTRMSAACLLGPDQGLGLYQEVDTARQTVGQAILSFPSNCSADMNITLGTGTFIGSTGDSVLLNL